jgi:predicted helicase
VKGENLSITIPDTGGRAKYCAFAAIGPIDFHFGSTADGYKAVPRYRFTADGNRVDNVTDFSLRVFEAAYPREHGQSEISKDEIFYYVYAVLHDPIYRERYTAELRREFPRIPFYPDFEKWSGWGRRLFSLHSDVEAVKPWPLKRVDRAAKVVEVKLRCSPALNAVQIDTETSLIGIPPDAWRFGLGNRSALEWVADNFRPKRSRDATVAARFPHAPFSEQKDAAIRQFRRVVRVSVETVAILDEMKALRR